MQLKSLNNTFYPLLVIKAIALILIFSFSNHAFSQNKQVKLNSSNYEKYIKSLPSFTMFGDNYFITGPSLKNKISTDNSDAKFHLGFRQRLTNFELPWNTFIYFTYQQKAFWDIYEDSFPFRETNYNPSLGIAKLFANETGITDGLWFAFEHESNGRNAENSRSWNFFSLQYFKPYGDDWVFRIKTWLPVGSLTDNEDITDYRGYFETGVTYTPSKDLYFDADLRQAFHNGWRGSIKLGISYKISKKSNQFLYLQYFGGYSEDLIDYNQHVSNLRLGIAFKDLFFNFKN
ncbi:phospholipase A [Kordia jejudonensis]|uniref:phospholipase A n=1 Tax=Kordia jejudonensis TaxID=1348245 RepID=UPI000629314C|nr:phospholipase A [Kordia jejudonensis]